MEHWFGIMWAHPHNSKYLVLFIIAAAVLVYRWARTNSLIKILGKSFNGLIFLHHTSYAHVTIKNMLWLIALFFIFLTLLHPCWNTKEETVVQEGRDLFVALDISRSMLAQDILPNRLEIAKQKIKTLVNALPSERIGLILFSGSSFIQCPLTRDRGAFLMYLNQIDADTIASGGTALDQALAQTIKAFKESNQKNKLLVIFTDGEDFSNDLASYKEAAKQQGLTIFTIGIGTDQGAPIPIFDQSGKQSGHLKDKNGNIVISKINESVLQALAEDVGGIYLHLSFQNNYDLQQLIHLVQKKEKELIEERTMAQHEEQYPWFLIISFILLAIEWML